MSGDDSLTRRQLLALGVAVGGYSIGTTGSGTIGGGGGGGPGISMQRTQRLRPVPGGAGYATDETVDATLAGGFETADGDPRWLTARHPIDPNFCGGRDKDALGTPVYQPADDGHAAIGDVADVGADNGANATDWATIEPADPADWTPHVLGTGKPAGTTEAAVGQRIVMSGATTGLIGGEVIGTSTAKVFLGCQFLGLIQYSVSADTDTNGNSGALVGTYDENDEWQLLGLHVFGDEHGRYAIPIGDVLADANLTIPTSTADPPTSSPAAGFIEGAVARYDPDAEQVRVLAANTGGDARQTTVRTLRQDGEEIERTAVDLDPWGREFVALSSGGHDTIELDTGDVRREVSL